MKLKAKCLFFSAGWNNLNGKNINTNTLSSMFSLTYFIV